ncbi:MAG TPA: GNAT family N-acetyltransferase [Bryobacteraceae bacterium]|jgi:phosphinothricin acetyltransferase|nr:GNAT family N-acetyltransferase [Bryobacteraceae bacterium]
MTPELATMTADDREAVREIYREGIATGNATFEKSVPDWENWDARHLPHCRLVARAGDQVLGWAALSPVSTRAVYAGVAEVSVYVATLARGRGVGSALLSTLVASSEQNGLWTLQASIFPENPSSIAIHRKCGFRVVGTRERIGFRDGQWRDTILMERRSAVAGR